MAGDLTTTIGELYKTFYRKFLQEDVPKASALSVRLMGGKAEELGGASRNLTWAIRNATGVGFGSLSQAGNYPAAGFMSAVNPVVACVDFAATVQFSGHVESMGSDEAKTFLTKKISRQVLDDLRAKVKKYIARMLMWDGTDILGTTAAASGTTGGYITLASGAASIHVFEAGDSLTLRTAASSGTEKLTNAATGAGRILQVNPQLGRIYLTDATGATAGGGDYISWLNIYGNTVIQGLRLLIDQTGTVNGLNRATAANAALSSNEIDLGGASIGSSDFDRIRDVTWEQGSLREESYNLIWCGNAKTRRQMTAATIGQVRFGSYDDLQVGAPSVKVGDTNGAKSFIVDQYCIDGEVFCFDPKNIRPVYPQGMAGGYLKENGSGGYVFQANATSGVGHSDSSLMYEVWRGNFLIDNCRMSGKLQNWTAIVS